MKDVVYESKLGLTTDTCYSVYNCKARKTHYVVERDHCAAIKRLNNKCGDLCGFIMRCNRI